MAPSVYCFSEKDNEMKLLASTSKETVELDKEAEVERKRKIGKEYYSMLTTKEIGNLLSGVWEVLYHSSSFKEYSSNPERDLRAIDMLIDETEKRIGHHVEPAPISTYIYDRDMTNADDIVRECFEKKAQHKSPDDHPEFAAREAKIAALISAFPGCAGIAEAINSTRQGKGLNKNRDTYDEYYWRGIWGSHETHHTTLKDIEKFISKPYAEDDFAYDSDKKMTVQVFICAGECKSDASVLIANHKEKMRQEEIKKKALSFYNTLDNKDKPFFVWKNILEIVDPKNRAVIEAIYKSSEKTR